MQNLDLPLKKIFAPNASVKILSSPTLSENHGVSSVHLCMVSCMPVYGVYVPGICMPVLSFSALYNIVNLSINKTEIPPNDLYLLFLG